jgi:deazaflavin-dependent oxidoreductase (nitroreductase family)
VEVKDHLRAGDFTRASFYTQSRQVYMCRFDEVIVCEGSEAASRRKHEWVPRLSRFVEQPRNRARDERKRAMPQQAPRLNYFSVILYHLTGERAYRGSADSPAGFLKLTTTGRKSGKPRSVHLIYIRDGANYVVTASYGGRQRHPGWFFNVRSNPQVTIEVQDRQLRTVAEIAGPDKRGELWARLIEIAPFYAGYQKRTSREIPMVILRPIEEQLD